MNQATKLFANLLGFGATISKAESLLVLVESIQKPETHSWIEQCIIGNPVYSGRFEEKIIEASRDIAEVTFDDGVEATKLAVITIVHTAIEENIKDLIAIISESKPELVFCAADLDKRKTTYGDAVSLSKSDLIQRVTSEWIASKSSDYSMPGLFSVFCRVVGVNQAVATLAGESDMARLSRLDKVRHDAVHRLAIPITHSELNNVCDFLRKLQINIILRAYQVLDVNIVEADVEEALESIKSGAT